MEHSHFCKQHNLECVNIPETINNSMQLCLVFHFYNSHTYELNSHYLSYSEPANTFVSKRFSGKFLKQLKLYLTCALRKLSTRCKALMLIKHLALVHALLASHPHASSLGLSLFCFFLPIFLSGNSLFPSLLYSIFCSKL